MRTLSFFLLAPALLLAVSCGQKPAVPTDKDPADQPGPKTERVRIVITADTIAKADDAFPIIEPVWHSVKIDGSYADYLASVAKFSRGQRLLAAVFRYRAAVHSGGHDQFYFTPEGIVWEDAMRGLSALGLPEAAAIVAESAKRMGGRPSFDRDARRNALDARDPVFDDLDQRLDALSTDIDIRTLRYIRERPREFLFDGEFERVVEPP